MDSQLDRQAFSEPPTRRACLVDGCPCKDARIISTRRVAFFSEWARQHQETADRQIEPDPDWADLFRPWRGRGGALAPDGDRGRPGRQASPQRLDGAAIPVGLDPPRRTRLGQGRELRTGVRRVRRRHPFDHDLVGSAR